MSTATRITPLFRTFPLCAILILAMAVPVLAAGGFDGPGPGNGGPERGYDGPPRVVTVDRARDMRSGSEVVLRGRIVRSMGNDIYEFEDRSGVMPVRIKEKTWRGQRVSPRDNVEIHGEVRNIKNRPRRIDVNRVVRR